MTAGDRGGPDRPHDEKTETSREEETDVHTLTGAYALDALDDVERARVERHLAECPSCSAEVRSFSETTALLASGATAVPPPGLRDKVMAEVARTRQLPPLPAAPAVGRDTGTPGRSARAVRGLAVAATSLLVLSLGLGALAWDAYEDADRARQAAAGMQEIVSDPSREMLDAEFSDGGKATIVVAGDRMVLVGDDVPAPPEGYGLQLWMIGEDGPRPSVMLEPTGDGRYWAQAEGVRPGDAFGVTVEEDGGAQTPSDQLVLTAGA